MMRLLLIIILAHVLSFIFILTDLIINVLLVGDSNLGLLIAPTTKTTYDSLPCA